MLLQTESRGRSVCGDHGAPAEGRRPPPPGRNYSHLFKVITRVHVPPEWQRGRPSIPRAQPCYGVNRIFARRSNAVRLEGSGVNQIWLPHLHRILRPRSESHRGPSTSPPTPFDAETGLAGGAAVNVSIKSGTVTSSTARRSNITTATSLAGAKPYFLPGRRAQAEGHIFNQMGGTIGGPIRCGESCFSSAATRSTYGSPVRLQGSSTIP